MRVVNGLLALSCSVLFACGGSPGGGDDGGDDDPTNLATLEVGLSQTQIHWVDGATLDAPTLTATLVKPDGTRQDVTDRVTWDVQPAGMAGVTNLTLEATGTEAGPGNVIAAFNSLEGSAQFEIFVEESVAPSDPGRAAPAGTRDLFEAATLDTGATLAVAYPPAGALVPPNLGEMEVHWRDTSAQDVFEISLSGGYVTLKTYVTTAGATNWNVLPQDQWKRLSQGAAGVGVDLEVRVRGLKTATPTTFVEGSEQIRIAGADLKGGLYYWNTSGGSSIYRYDMLTPEVPAQKFFPSAGQTGCVGCHAVSRSGNVVAYRQEGGNMNYGNALDVASQSKFLTENSQQWNYAAIHPNDNHMIYTKEDGLYLAELNNQANGKLVGSGAERYAHPEFSVAGTTIVATRVVAGSEVYTTQGKLVTLSYDAATKAVGAPADFHVPAANRMAWYPSFSPDDQWVMFNEAPTGAGSAYDAYDNQYAEMWIKRADGSGNAIRLSEAEVSGAGNSLTYNSWPKFTPFVSNEPLAAGGTESVMWFTVASRRGFGVRTNDNATSPQLWLAPFYPERAARGEPASGPAVRLPFQKLNEGNHIAQWTEQIVTIQ